MKKILLCLVTVIFLLSGCQNSEKAEKPPAELPKIKKSLSALYSFIRKEQEYSLISEGDAVAVLSSYDTPIESEEQKRFSVKTDYYFKEILRSMEDIRVANEKNAELCAVAQQLDASVNLMGHNLNQMDISAARKALNCGIDSVGEIYRCYGREEEAAVLHLEYCLNLLEIEANDTEKMPEILDLTESAIKELEGKDSVYQRALIQMKESLRSLRDAIRYCDSKLICMKVEIMRKNFEEVALLVMK